MPIYESYAPEVNSAVVAAVRLAFVRARTSPRMWKHRLNEGRLDPRSTWRFGATGHTDIFRDRTAPGASRVNLHILVDGSTSMDARDQHKADGTASSRIKMASDITATLVDAFRSQPQVRLNVWLHNTGAQAGADLAIWPIVTNGHGRDNVGMLPRLTAGGNGDGYAIKWVGQKLHRDHRKGEVDLLIMVSDGLPSWVSGNRDWNQPDISNNGVKLVTNVVRELNGRGTKVLSIAIVPNNNQTEMYGSDSVIPFTGDWNQLAVDIARSLGDVLADAAKDPKTAKR